jgi:CHAT domain-containing protein
MNEQRLQAYYQLIQNLLECPSGEESEILAANTDLLDAGFVQVVTAVAEYFAQQGQENTANWLRNLARQLNPETRPISQDDIETYAPFVEEVLQATSDSNGDAQVIYPLLAANTDKLNNNFAEILRDWSTNRLAEAEPDTAAYIAEVIFTFSNLIQQFPLGSKASNMEIAITGYEIALTVYTRSAFPEDWAMTQNNLGIAYRDRILGEKAENIEIAIAAYTQALIVYTQSAFPEKWAMTQYNLGNAYCERILGEKAENIELAIKAFTQALIVYTQSAFPEKWAPVQNNLGNAYSDRILGEKAENIELAIAVFTQALTVYTQSAFPEQWATVQNNLGNAYSDRILGEKAENIELAIKAFTQALTVYTQSAFPEKWATVQYNLGIAYRDRILGEKAENIEKAIAAYTQALTVRTQSAFPEKWATTQNNLGAAYGDRILGEKAENIELAIAAYTAALSVRTRNAFPQKYAETWSNIGILYQNAKEFESAYNAFVKAIETVEALRGEIISGEEAKRKQAEEWNELYRRMVEVCLALRRKTEAIEYVERSKTRNLVELILNRDLKTIFCPKVVTKLEKRRDEIAKGQYQLQNGKAENPKVLAQHLQQLRQQRNKLQDKYLPVGSGFKFEQFQKALDERTAIIEWYIASDRILAFVVKPHGQELTFWQSQPEDLDALINWTNEYLGDYDEYKQKTSDKWQDQLEERLKKLAEILHIEEILAQVPKECDRLILIPHRFLHLFPLHALPVGESYLLDLFPKGVGYAPSCQLLQQVQLRQRPDFQSLFAIQNPTEDLDYAELEVESISILTLFSSRQVFSNSEATKAALTQATPKLNLVNCLHFSCHGSFDPTYLLLANPYVSSIPPNADPKRYVKLLNEKIVDLNKCLTLGNLFERDFDLNQCRLVVLSACETGLIDFSNSSDEYIGLPSGFLYAGSVGVVNSLWTVNELSISFLMIKFFQNFHAALTANQDASVASNQDASVASALKEAQLWLRNATKEDLQKWTDKLSLDDTWKSEISGYFNTIEAGDKPFNSPYHWAAFTAVGK